MSVFSKFFQLALAPATCKDIVHPHTDSCFLAATQYFFKPILTTVQFFVPLFLISLAARKEKYDGQLIKEMVKNLVGAVAASLLTGSIGTCFMCGLYKIFGRFHCSTMVGMPGFLGALSIFTVPNKIAIMFTHSALVMITEVFIKQRGFFIFKYLDRVIWVRTIVFMLLSAVMLDCLRKVKPDISWFIQPVKRRSKRRYESYDDSPMFDAVIPISGNICSHKKSCDEFVVKEVKTYSKIGIGIELIRSTVNNLHILKRNFIEGICAIIRKINLKFILFAIGYPCGYRILTCLFNRLYGIESKYANILAGFVAGGFFYFYPQSSFLAYAIACTIEIVWQRMQNSKRPHQFIRKINELPLARIFYPIIMGYLFHMRSFYPWQTPTLLHKVMSFVTCRHDEQMLLNCYSFLIPSSV